MLIPIQVGEYAPIAKGAEDDLSWHSTLADNASLVDAIDCAQTTLFKLPDYLDRAHELDELLTAATKAAGVFDVSLNNELLTRCGVAKADLARTRSEALLLRLFCPDTMARFTATERDTKVRDIKAKLVRYTKWNTIFKPIHSRAVEVMKLK